MENNSIVTFNKIKYTSGKSNLLFGDISYVVKMGFLFFLTFFLHPNLSVSQIYAPVHWSYAAKKINSTQAVLLIKATIDDEWHVYSVNQKDGGPQKTSFVFTPSRDYKLTGNVIEPQPKRKYETAFGMDVFYFENSVIFQQKIVLTASQTTVDGRVKYMVCNSERCLPPDEVTFKIPIK